VTPDISNSLHTTYISSSINLQTIHHRNGKTRLTINHTKTNIYDNMQKSHTFISLNICIFFDNMYSDIRLTEVCTMINN